MTITAGVVNTKIIRVGVKQGLLDPEAKKITDTINQFYSTDLKKIRIVKIYEIHDNTQEELEKLFFDPIIEEIVPKNHADWTIEIATKSGVTNNTATVAKITVQDFLGREIESIATSTQYLFWGNLSRDTIEKIAFDLLGNPLIHDIRITGLHTEINLDVSDEELIRISKERQLALSLEEMKAIRKGLERNPTDVELEAIAQTWSEHCKHKIFNARIQYKENGVSESINSLFKTYIKKATNEIHKDWLVSVFTDNAGIITFNDRYNLAFKVETHNSPSALDPYGGALTGILGVNRDIMGAGNGARLIANTDVFCFAPPNYNKPLPKRLHHPRRVLEGVRLGVEHGGNKSGVPTLNGSLVFDERYLGKPLVYCGSVGIMPKEINGKPSHVKEIRPGDLIVIAGGRTGRDGIHGATFSSEELHSESPTSAVQIGDPFTQKKLHDFLLDARDRGLYRTLTDNGAGGFSSSVGELAILSNGCEMHLDRALLKQTNMMPWEILVSESQERMTLAVAEECWNDLELLADYHEVEIFILGHFTDTGRFHILYEGETVGDLSLEFLHNGLPQMQLDAEWVAPSVKPQPHMDIHQWLSSYNVCSKEKIVRQYDHEVQGGSILKPMVGHQFDGPSDAAVFCPLEDFKIGVVLSHGICPQYSDIDAYDMATNAVDEAVRNAVAVGADPDRLAILDNFCWPDPVYHPEKNPDGKYKLAQLVRANKGLYDAAIAFGAPIISGKDSMKNDYHIDGVKISIPPTLLVSAIGTISDVTKVVSMDVKQPGDYIYLIGDTKPCIKVDFVKAVKCYQLVYQAIQQELISSCHDCSEGGVAVALAEKAFAGGFGIEAQVDYPFVESPSRLLVTVDPNKKELFEQLIPQARYIGTVRHDDKFILGQINETIGDLKKSWQRRDL